ncbi:Flagellar hook-length control protein FliK [Chelatococcus sambhunathii]|uniref:Flagellar hook-length control protein FliK n=1 Tax=Chelatococcus sambhunathii TaxID=363953 RepID=A0ABM9U211_9HYPH|nr:flagellar hook-length control protein FliK [Chelatococcus sambhunathii]CUA85168.1 Flagellar hook-length control protein FliK [Chelatococcus sambhunathii]
MTMLDPSFLRMPTQRDVAADSGARGEAYDKQGGDAFRTLLEKVQGAGARGAAAQAEDRADAMPARSLRALVERLGEAAGAGEEAGPLDPRSAEGEGAEALPDNAEGKAGGGVEGGVRHTRTSGAEGLSLPVSDRPGPKQAAAEPDGAALQEAEVDKRPAAAQRLTDTKQGFGVDIAPQPKERPLPKMTVAGRETHFEPVGMVKPQTGEGEPVEEALPRVKGRIESAPPVALREGRRQAIPAAETAALRAPKVAVQNAGNGQGEGLPAPTLQRLGERLAGEMRSLASGNAQSGAATMAAHQAQTGQHAGGPVRILHIQLHPADLGSVSVRLRLVGDGIEVHMRASDARTVQMLQNDSEALTGVLRAAGYRPEVVTLQISSADAGSGQLQQGGGQQTAGQQAFQGETWGGGRGASSSRGEEQAQGSRREGGGDGHAGRVSDRDSSSGIYL